VNNISKSIKRDVRKTMALPLAIKLVSSIVTYYVAIYTADIIGAFSDSILKMNASSLNLHIKDLVICIALAIIIIPLFEILWGIVMLNNSLKHDRIVMDNFINKKYSAIKNYDLGDIDYRLEQDPNNYRFNWMEIASRTIAVPISLAFLLYLSVKISALYTLCVVLIALIKIIFPFVINKKLMLLDLDNRNYETQLRNIEIDIISNPIYVNLLSLKDAMFSRHSALFNDYYLKIVKYKFIQILSQSIGSTANTIFNVVVILIGALLASNGNINISHIVQFVGLFAVYAALFTDIENLIFKIPVQKNLFSRMELFYSEHEKNASEEVGKFDRLDVEKLMHRYNEKTTFFNFTFSIIKGDKVAICGRNGSGKSTLLKILCGLIDDYEGCVKVNLENIEHYSLRSLHDTVLYISQEAFVFRASLADNILLFCNDPDKRKRALDLIEELALDGEFTLDTQVAPERLSGGERQKISLARAMISNAEVLLFDEPTNNLDVETAKFIKKIILETPKTILYVTQDKPYSEQHKVVRAE
jgi:ATP-binding cassette subfamily B protein